MSGLNWAATQFLGVLMELAKSAGKPEKAAEIMQDAMDMDAIGKKLGICVHPHPHSYAPLKKHYR